MPRVVKEVRSYKACPCSLIAVMFLRLGIGSKLKLLGVQITYTCGYSVTHKRKLECCVEKNRLTITDGRTESYISTHKFC